MSEIKPLLESMRREYVISPLSKAEMDSDPTAQFRKWFDQAHTAGLIEPNAMSLATAAEGEVTCRTVLLKAFDKRGFVFFTNYTSRKAKQIAKNPKVSLHFAWLSLARQVEIRGEAQKISSAESLAYFLNRPYGSRIGAWVSQQSRVISSRNLLEAKFMELCRRFVDGEIPKPDFWGGYRVVPSAIEFWQGGTNRLHDRFLYTKQTNAAWHLARLSP